MYWIAPLFGCTTLKELECVMTSRIVVLNCENTSQLVKHSFDKLHEKVLQCDSSPIWNDDVMVEEIQCDVDLDITIANDKKQEQNSQSYKYFKEILNIFVFSKICTFHRKLPDMDIILVKIFTLAKQFVKKFCR